MRIETQTDGFTKIETAGMVILAPSDDSAGGDERIEIRVGNQRLWIDDALVATQIEKFDENA